jgi:cellulose synthase/poly-beta-1,6-N-acetylglucosamine synthase-like glycosyltransferase
LFTIVAMIELLIGNRSVDALRDTSPVPGASHKKVSIIVAARNEQRNIRTTLQSLLDLEYRAAGYVLFVERTEGQQGVSGIIRGWI